jgi:protocatechuate 3,4-dioxygenase beta subunit
MPARLSRRDLVEKCLASGLVIAASPFLAHEAFAFFGDPRKATPANVLGPFYKKGAPAAARIVPAGEAGFPLAVVGQVLDTRGGELPGAVVEVWHADHHGVYDLDGYRCRGLEHADAKGGYAFESVMPGHYPDRVAQHVHYRVSAPGHKTLVTQLYFATDPVFDGDPDKNFGRDPLVGSRDLVRPVTLVGDPGDVKARVSFDLVLEAV